MPHRLAPLVLIAILAGCGLAPSPPASPSASPPAAADSPEPSPSPSPPAEVSLDCGESLIGGQLWQDGEGGAGLYNARHGFTPVRWPAGYRLDHGSFRIFNNFTLYDGHGRTVGDGGDTIMVAGEWTSDDRTLFAACAVLRVVATNPGDPRTGFITPVESCVIWQGTRRGDRHVPNPFLVADAGVCGEFPTL